MPTQYKKMRAAEILSLDAAQFNNMNRQELADAVSVLSMVANKRVKRLEKEQLNTPAIQQLKGNTYFSVSGKDLNALRSELKRVTSFLGYKTSTVSGERKIMKDIQRKLSLGDMTNEEYNKMWKLYHKLEESNKMVKVKYKDVIYAIKSGITEGATDEEIHKNVDKKLEEIYIAEQEANADVASVFDNTEYLE